MTDSHPVAVTAASAPRLHVEKVLNHTIDDVTEIFYRHDYGTEKRNALEQLEKALERILKRDSNVIPLSRFDRSRTAR